MCLFGTKYLIQSFTFFVSFRKKKSAYTISTEMIQFLTGGTGLLTMMNPNFIFSHYSVLNLLCVFVIPIPIKSWASSINFPVLHSYKGIPFQLLNISVHCNEFQLYETFLLLYFTWPRPGNQQWWREHDCPFTFLPEYGSGKGEIGWKNTVPQGGVGSNRTK